MDVYTKQCALRVTAKDRAVMGATLADGGVNPLTGQRVVSAAVCRDTLAILASNGLYERSGEWLFEIGLPGKSGVAGGVVTVAPGKAGIGALLTTAGFRRQQCPWAARDRIPVEGARVEHLCV